MGVICVQTYLTYLLTNSVFWKVFKTYDIADILLSIMQLPISMDIDTIKLKYISKLKLSKNKILAGLFKISSYVQLTELLSDYNMPYSVIILRFVIIIMPAYLYCAAYTRMTMNESSPPCEQRRITFNDDEQRVQSARPELPAPHYICMYRLLPTTPPHHRLGIITPDLLLVPIYRPRKDE